MTQTDSRFSAVDLALAPDFSLGSLGVRPSICRVLVAGREQRVEPRVMQVLIVLARNLGATTTRDQLIEACWGGRIASDDAISRVIAQVRAIARLSDPPAFGLETVPKVGFRLLAAATAEPTTAPEPELRPSPPPVAPDLVAAPSAPLSVAAKRFFRHRSIAVGGAALAVILAGAWAAWRLAGGLGVGAEAAPPTVAVAAFANPVGDPTVSSIAHGVQAETEKMLAKIPTEVRVVDAGASTGSEHPRMLVRGAVVRHGAQARIDVQLLDSTDGSVLWAESFDRGLDQSLELQSEVAMATAAVLRAAAPQITAGSHIPTAALGGYLAAVRWAQTSYGGRTVTEIIPPLEMATRQAPDFAAAWAMLADAYRVESRYLEEEEQRATLDRARAAANRALLLAPRSGFAHAVLSSIEPEWAWRARADELSRAEALSPNDPAVVRVRFELMRRLGRLEEVRLAGLRMVELDPFSQSAQQRAWSYELDNGDRRAAERNLIRIQKQDAGTALLWISLLEANLAARDKVAAARNLRALETVWPQIVTDRHFTEVDGDALLAEYRRRTADVISGRDDSARLAAQARADWDHLQTSGRGQGCATEYLPRMAQGRVDLAWAVVEELYLRKGYVGVHATCGHPVYAERQAATWPLFVAETDKMRRDVRIWSVFKGTGLARYWSDTGVWPDFCRDTSLGYDCRTEARKVLSIP